MAKIEKASMLPLISLLLFSEKIQDNSIVNFSVTKRGGNPLMTRSC